MDDKFQDEMSTQKLPEYARTAFDSAYTQIRKAPGKKASVFRFRRPLLVLAAGTLLAVLWQTPVTDAVKNMLGFGEFASQQVMKSNFVQQPDSAYAEDQKIRISVKQIYSDENGLGLEFYIQTEDGAVAEKIKGIEYRLQNGDGTYLLENISDDKPLHGDNHLFASGSKELSKAEAGSVTIKEIWTPGAGQKTPSLTDLKLTVESLFIENGSAPFQRIEGNWQIAVPMKDVAKFAPIRYQAAAAQKDLRLENAVATPTGMRVAFSYQAGTDSAKKHQEEVFSPVLRDSAGETYESGYSSKEKDGRIYIETIFSYTGYDAKKPLTLELRGFDPVQLVPENKK